MGSPPHSFVPLLSCMSVAKKYFFLLLTELQGTLGDYNTLVDLQNTNSDKSSVLNDLHAMTEDNARQTRTLDEMFNLKQENEKKVRQLEIDVERVRSRVLQAYKIYRGGYNLEQIQFGTPEPQRFLFKILMEL